MIAPAATRACSPQLSYFPDCRIPCRNSHCRSSRWRNSRWREEFPPPRRRLVRCNDGTGDLLHDTRMSCRSCASFDGKVPPRRRLEHPAIDQEAGFLGQLVIEPHGGRIGLMGHPIDPAGTGRLCFLIDGLDQLAADPLPAHAVDGEEIREVAAERDLRGGEMIEVMR